MNIFCQAFIWNVVAGGVTGEQGVSSPPLPFPPLPFPHLP